jgi:predicted phosphodiesterase
LAPKKELKILARMREKRLFLLFFILIFHSMTRILLLSDTHSHIDEVILKHVAWADEVWHAGDIGDLSVTDTLKKHKPLRAVYGNIDGNEARIEFPLHNRFMCEQVSVWITHIGGYPGKYNPAVRDEMAMNPPKLFICGTLIF